MQAMTAFSNGVDICAVAFFATIRRLLHDMLQQGLRKLRPITRRWYASQHA